MLPWREHKYGSGKSATVGLLSIMVEFDGTRDRSDKSPPYIWSVNGKRGKNTYNTMEQAEQAAITYAKRLLQLTIEALED